MDTYVFSQAILLKGQIYIFSITTLKFQVSRKLPPMKIAPQSGPGFGLGLALELGLGGGGNFPQGQFSWNQNFITNIYRPYKNKRLLSILIVKTL